VHRDNYCKWFDHALPLSAIRQVIQKRWTQKERRGGGAIKKEELYPYVYRLKLNGKEHYDKLEVDHPALYLIGIYTPGEDVVKQFDGMGLLRKRPNFPVNLNYETNHSTKLYTFYLLMEGYFSKIDKKFVF
jgi:hypothetical protein